MNWENHIHACWLGKGIGGTLGMPYEGAPGSHALTFYDPVPTSSAPNDDLDLQIVWAAHLLTNRIRQIHPRVFVPAWQRHVRFPFDEYGCCLRNIAYGLQPPELGAFDNWFAECMGAAIRSELWACLAPGNPSRAAGLAWCDAVCDHAGEGVWAEVFLAALQSAAFVEKQPRRLLEEALRFLPSESRVRQAVADTVGWWSQAGGETGWRGVRGKILRKYATANFTDVPANLAFIVLGWLAGEGDFGRSLCIAVNCGLDTDCTAASVGALLGIIDPSSIPPEWSQPVGEGIVLSKAIEGIEPPANLSELTEWTLRLTRQLTDDQPSLGAVLPRHPANGNHSPIRIPVEIACMDRTDLPDRPADYPDATRGQSMGRECWTGHWTRLAKSHFQSPAMLIQTTFRTAAPVAWRVMAFAATETLGWVDGRRLTPAPPNPYCHDSHAPSFHRGGRGHFETPVLDPGRHRLTVVVPRPANGESWDLVLGLGHVPSLLWNPAAFVETGAKPPPAESTRPASVRLLNTVANTRGANP